MPSPFEQRVYVAVGFISAIWFATDSLLQYFGRMILGSGIPIEVSFHLLGFRLPQILVFILPSVVVAITVAILPKFFSNRITTAALVFGITSMVASYCLNDLVVPHTNRTGKKLELIALYRCHAFSGLANITFRERVLNFRHNRAYFVERFEENELRDIVIVESNDNSVVRIITSPKGKFKGANLLLENGSSHLIRNEQLETIKFGNLAIPQVHRFKRYWFELPQIATKDMTLQELTDHIELTRLDKSVSRDLLFTYYKKFADPLCCLAASIMGASFVLMSRRFKTAAYLQVAAGTAFYFLLQECSDGFGKSGTIPVMVAAWMPTGLMCAVSAIIVVLSNIRKGGGDGNGTHPQIRLVEVEVPIPLVYPGMLP